jgi:hypothetical protein
MFADRRHSGKVKDTCWLCSAPVYETDSAVYYLGLWIHPDCYEGENLSAESDRIRPDESN